MLLGYTVAKASASPLGSPDHFSSWEGGAWRRDYFVTGKCGSLTFHVNVKQPPLTPNSKWSTYLFCSSIVFNPIANQVPREEDSVSVFDNKLLFVYLCAFVFR